MQPAGEAGGEGRGQGAELRCTDEGTGGSDAQEPCADSSAVRVVVGFRLTEKKARSFLQEDLLCHARCVRPQQRPAHGHARAWPT